MLANRSAAPPQSSKRGGVADGSSTAKKRKMLDKAPTSEELRLIVTTVLKKHGDVKNLGFYKDVFENLRDYFNKNKAVEEPKARFRLKRNFTQILAFFISELKELDAGADTKEGDKKRELIKVYQKEHAKYETRSLQDLLNYLDRKKKDIEEKGLKNMDKNANGEFHKIWEAYHKHFSEKEAELTKENAPEAKEFTQLLESVRSFHDEKVLTHHLNKRKGRQKHQGDSAGASSSQVEAHHPEELTSEEDQSHDSYVPNFADAPAFMNAYKDVEDGCF